MNILALDLGTTSGWATTNRAGHVLSGSAGFHPGGSPAQRWLRFRQFLSDQRNTFGSFEVCYYERVLHHTAVQAAHVYGAFEAMLQIWAEINNVRLVQVSPGTIKKHWTGKGNAKKDAMIETAKAKGFNPVDDNEADALALLSYAITQELAAQGAPF